jgi:hypothetical protein
MDSGADPSPAEPSSTRRVLTSVLRRVLFAAAPRTATALVSARARAHRHHLVKAWGLNELDQRLIRELGPVTVSGPFQGVRLSPMTWAEHIGPYLLGTYEFELHPWWPGLFGQRFDMIVDVGANTGYYAVGLALRFPQAMTIAFDTDWWARDATREMAAANGAGNISIERYCTPAWVAQHVRGHAFILSDCEGYESELFGRAGTPDLASATLLIELHEHIVPGVTARIESRFARSHLAAKVSSSSATPVVPDVPIASFTDAEIVRASTEVRPPQEWLLLTPRPAA